jgi:hypothetical protein
MRSGDIPFQFDLSDLLGRATRTLKGRLGNVTLHLPFVDVEVSPENREKQVARELVIRLKDRRVLSAVECCDNCIDQALTSLQEIRRLLVDKQVELSDMQGGPLYLVIDLMREGIRQFLTYEQVLTRGRPQLPHSALSDFRRSPAVRQSYFDALELLRGHLSRCLGQVAAIAGMNAPQDGVIAEYRGPWVVAAYVAPKLSQSDGAT